MPIFNPLRNLAIVCSLSLCAASSVFAQDSAAHKDGVNFRILTFERVKNLRTIQWKKGKQWEDIAMHKNNFTPSYQSTGRKLLFFRPRQDDEERPVPAGSITIDPSLGKHIILIAIPVKGGNYKFLPISDNLSNFSPGGMKIINLSNAAIATIINNKKHLVKARRSISISSVSSKNSRHSYPVEFYHRQNKKWAPFSSGYWQHEPETRFLTFCYRESGAKFSRLRIRSIRIVPRAQKSRSAVLSHTTN